MEREPGPQITAYAGSEAVFLSPEHVVIPAADTAAAGFPHDLVETERGEVEPVRAPETKFDRSMHPHG